MRAMTSAAAATAVVVAAVTSLRTAGAMSCSDSWIEEDETPFPAMSRVNVTRLAALADQFLRTAAASAAADDDGTTAVRVDVELRMNRRSAVSARLNKACGYEVRANGTAAAASTTVSRSAYLPAYEPAVCRDGHVYRAQFVRAGGTHRQTVRLRDGVAAVSVELRANGKNYLTVDSACVVVTLRSGDGGRGARAFCVDLELLKSCWCLQAGRGVRPRRRSDYYLGFDGISLAMSKWNVREIVFRDVAALADGFGALARDADDPDAQDAVCGRVELVPGGLDAELDSCPVEKRYAVAAAATGAGDVIGDAGKNDGGGGASFEFRPERMDISRLLYDCAPRSPDLGAAGGAGKKLAGDRGADNRRQQKSGARASSSCGGLTSVVRLFVWWSVALYVVATV